MSHGPARGALAGRELVRRHGVAPVRDGRRRQRPSRAEPRPPRPAEELRAELRGELHASAAPG